MSGVASEHPFDPGLQTERTLLAWRRTCLALAVVNAVAIRYLHEALGPLAAAIGITGIALSGIAWIVATMRYRRVHLGLVQNRMLSTGGRLVALVSASILAACVAGVVLLVTLWRPW